LTATASAHGLRERSAFVYTYEGESDANGTDKIALRETELRTGAPLIRTENLRLIIGLQWTMYDFIASGEETEDFKAHSLRLPFRAVWPRKNDWTWMALVAPAIRSDFESISSDDLGLSALTIGTYPWRPDARISAGAVYSEDFGRSRLFPAIGITWTPSPAWIVDASFPRPRVSYQFNEDLTLMALMEPGGDQWNVELDGVERDIALKEYRAGFGVEWAPVRNILVQAHAGGVFARELDARGGGAPRVDRELGETWYVRLGVIFR
jgi:hypothetical protein